MARDREAIAADVVKVERELGAVRSRPSREDVERHIDAHIVGLRASVSAALPSPEAVASGSAMAGREAAVLAAAFVTLCGSGAREAERDRCKVQVNAAPSAKDKAKAISGLEGRLARLRDEAREAELAELKADHDRLSQQFEAERNAEENAARSAA